MNSQTRATLAAEGLDELIPLLEEAGLFKLEDVALTGVTETDLFNLGVTKFFHQKKLLRLSAEAAQRVGKGDNSVTSRTSSRRSSGSGAASSGTSPLQPTTSPQKGPGEGGDHVAVHVLAVRSVGPKQLSEREHYVKVSLCDLCGSSVVPLEHAVFRTQPARGPFPTFTSDAALASTPPFLVPTNFRSHCIAIELKEKRLLTDNKYIGVAVFPISYFHKFGPQTVVDSWFTLRSETNSSESTPTGQVRVRFAVPGGCPKAVGRAYHVTGVNMRERKLRVTVFDAEIEQCSGGAEPRDYFHEAPSTYISLTLDHAEEHGRRETTVVDGSYTPQFDETFDFFHEIAHAKLLTVKLKQSVSVISHPTIGVVRIPLQFFLSQTNAADIEDVFEAFDHDDTSIVRARIHIRIEVRQRRGEERNVNFVRTESIKQQRFLQPVESVAATAHADPHEHLDDGEQTSPEAPGGREAPVPPAVQSPPAPVAHEAVNDSVEKSPPLLASAGPAPKIGNESIFSISAGSFVVRPGQAPHLTPKGSAGLRQMSARSSGAFSSGSHERPTLVNTSFSTVLVDSEDDEVPSGAPVLPPRSNTEPMIEL